MKRFALVVMALFLSLGNAQEYIPVDTYLPLVTVGTENSGSWFPEGDRYELILTSPGNIKLWIGSPTIDRANQVGDERYSEAPLEATFSFIDSAGNLIQEAKFGEGESDWVSFLEASLDAGTYYLETSVSGTGKNVYDFLLEINGERTKFVNRQASINAFDDAWRQGLIFNLDTNVHEACVLEIYDGDGPDELEMRMANPYGQYLDLAIPDDRAWLSYILPSQSGRYAVELRQTSHAYQGTNSIRARVSCEAVAQPVNILTSPQTNIMLPINPIEVIVIDTAGNSLNIPYEITGKLERSVSLAEDTEYKLVDKHLEGGIDSGSREARFGLEGGRVTFILEKPVVNLPVPLPRPVPAALLVPSQSIPLPLIETHVVAPEPISLPSPKAELVTQPELSLLRSLDHHEGLSCQVIGVTLTVTNIGNVRAHYQLSEMLPAGALIVSDNNLTTDGATVNDNNLYWQGSLEPGQSLTYSYAFEITPVMSINAGFRASLQGIDQALVNQPVTSAASLTRLQTIASIERLLPDGDLYAGDEAEYLLTLSNPLNRDVTLSLEPSAVRLALLDLPETLFVEANSSASVRIRALVEAAGVNAIQVTPFACDPLFLEKHQSGDPAIHREEALAVPELPPAYQNTTVTIDMAAFQLPVIDGLILVHKLPENIQYINGSSHIDGYVVNDPEIVGNALVFRLPSRNIATVSFDVVHEAGSYIATKLNSSLIVLSPEPEVLIGSEDVLDLIQRSVSIETQADVRERIDAVILSPSPGTLIRSGNTTAIITDAPLGDRSKLFVNGQEVSGNKIGQKTYDESLGRQSFDYIGVELQAGLNIVRLESTDANSRVFRDEIQLYVSGVPEMVNLSPITELIADSASPLRFSVKVRDAWGNVPSDSFITFVIDGASPTGADANEQQEGYQVRVIDGQAELILEPLRSPRTIHITSIIGKDLGTQSFDVESNLRDWVINGYGSAGAGYTIGEDAYFGVEGSFFARGRLFDNYLLTLAANYPLAPLGFFGDDPYLSNYNSFPLTGSSGTYSQDAFSQDGYYFRIERDQSFLQYSDFSTRFEGRFLNLSRAYTGLNAEWNAYGLKLSTYAANASLTDRVTDLHLKSDGTRVYQLPHQNILADSLILEIIKGQCSSPSIFESDENDPLIRILEAGLDYFFDESGIVRLTFRLPLADSKQNCYYLRANYQLEAASSAESDWQFGIQGQYQLGNTTLRLGSYQDNQLADDFNRVSSAGASSNFGAVRLDTEFAYGENQDSSGIAVHAQAAYANGPITAETRYELTSEGYRSATINNGDNAGQRLELGASYRINDTIALSTAAQAQHFSSDNSLQFGVNLNANLLVSDDVQLGEFLLARTLTGQFGVQFNQSRQQDNGLSLLMGSTLRDIFGLEQTEFSITHSQTLAGASASSTDISIAYQLLDNLTLRVTDRVIWGSNNSFLLGLEAGFSNSQILSDLCRVSFCDFNDPFVPLGDTRVAAQYELGSGVSDDAGRLLLGVDTNYPITDELSLSLGADQQINLNNTSQNRTALSTGLTLSNESVNAQALYDLSFGVSTKHALFGSSTFAFNNNFFLNFGADYLNDSGQSSDGFKFSVAAAYRAEAITVLTNQTARFGLFASGGNVEFNSDTRLNWQLSPEWSIKASYLANLSETLGYQDLISLGGAYQVWQGGELSAYGRLFHDWKLQGFNLGASLELSQHLGCGANLVAGYNFFDSVDRNYGSVFGDSGAYLRLDFIFDEQWRCGSSEISARVFLDKNANQTIDEGEIGISGVPVRLVDESGNVVAFTYSDAEGYYHFNNIAPASYRLEVDAPYSYGLTNHDYEKSITNNITTFSKPLQLAFASQHNDLNLGFSNMEVGDN